MAGKMLTVFGNSLLVHPGALRVIQRNTEPVRHPASRRDFPVPLCICLRSVGTQPISPISFFLDVCNLFSIHHRQPTTLFCKS